MNCVFEKCWWPLTPPVLQELTEFPPTVGRKKNKKKQNSVLSVLRLAVFVSLSRNHWDWKRLKQHFFIIICSIFPNVINLRLHTIILEATRITDLYSGPNPCRLFADELTKSKRRVHICPLQLWLFFSPPPWPQTFLCLSVHFQIRIKTDCRFLFLVNPFFCSRPPELSPCFAIGQLLLPCIL